MRRLRITCNMPGKKPVWKWNKKNGKLSRDTSKGGIDWYRYYKKILEAKLLPFAQECKKDRPNTIVMEDNASPHAHQHQFRVYKLWDIKHMLWPPNSPDLNAIERPWFYMKKDTTKGGAATGQKQIRLDWIDCWDNMLQTKIQAWIESIPVHIKEVIALDGGNEYPESRDGRRRNLNRVH